MSVIVYERENANVRTCQWQRRPKIKSDISLITRELCKKLSSLIKWSDLINQFFLEIGWFSK